MSDPANPYPAQPPAYPPPAQPAFPPGYAQPVSAAPVSTYPTAVYPPPPAPRRTSVWTWIFGALSLLLLIGGGVMGFLYSKALTQHRDRIASLEQTVAAHAKTITEKDSTISARERELASAEDDLAVAQDCVDAVRRTLRAQTDAEFDVAYDEMVGVCL